MSTLIKRGFAAHFPIELKDSFRATFPSARWHQDGGYWEVGVRSGQRLREWAALVAPAADALEAAEAAALSAVETARIEAEVAAVRAQIAETRGIAATINAAVALGTVRARLLDAQTRLKQERQALAQKTEQAHALLESVCDIDAVLAARQAMVRSHRQVGAPARRAFIAAQAVIAAEHAKLRATGYRSRGMGLLCSMSFNRPDRDSVDAVPATLLYELESCKSDDD